MVVVWMPAREMVRGGGLWLTSMSWCVRLRGKERWSRVFLLGYCEREGWEREKYKRLRKRNMERETRA